MYIVDQAIKEDPQRRWALPDRVFFACGACHILAYAFLEAYRTPGLRRAGSSRSMVISAITSWW